MKTIMRYAFALALCAGPVPASAQPVPARTMAQMDAEVDAAIARDRPLVEGFLAALATASTSSWQPPSYSWYSGNGPWQTITKARFVELISTCAIREIGGQITLTSDGRAALPPLAYNGVSVGWDCAGAGAVASRLMGFFNFEHGGGGVQLAPDPATERR